MRTSSPGVSSSLSSMRLRAAHAVVLRAMVVGDQEGGRDPVPPGHDLVLGGGRPLQARLLEGGRLPIAVGSVRAHDERVSLAGGLGTVLAQADLLIYRL